MAEGFKKYVYIVLGSICLALGVIGIFLPVLPTTPFLLLTSFFYLRGSEKLHSWLIHNKTFGEYLYNYLTYKAIKKSTKVSALIFLWITLGISILMIERVYIKIFLILVGIGVSIHIVMLKTIKDEDPTLEHKEKLED